jgi:uncharacterized membrane protein
MPAATAANRNVLVAIGSASLVSVGVIVGINVVACVVAVVRGVVVAGLVVACSRVITVV